MKVFCLFDVRVVVRNFVEKQFHRPGHISGLIGQLKKNQPARQAYRFAPAAYADKKKECQFLPMGITNMVNGLLKSLPPARQKGYKFASVSSAMSTRKKPSLHWDMIMSRL